MQNLKKSLKCREAHMKQTIKKNKKLYEQVVKVQKKMSQNADVVLSKTKLTNTLNKQIQKETDTSKKNHLKQNLKRLLSLQNKIKKKTPKSKKQIITRKDKLALTKWRKLLNTGHHCDEYMK